MTYLCSRMGFQIKADNRTEDNVVGLILAIAIFGNNWTGISFTRKPMTGNIVESVYLDLTPPDTFSVILTSWII